MIRPTAITDTQLNQYMKKFAEDKTIDGKTTFKKYLKQFGWCWSKKESTFIR